ncbi:MAG: hypothetical protein RLZZ330_524 [Actinomycetota bacterium]|jgi:hypothetical protein
MKVLITIFVALSMFFARALNQNILTAGGQNAGITTHDIKTPGNGLCC